MNITGSLGGLKITALVMAMAAVHVTTMQAVEVISNVTAKAHAENTTWERLASRAVNGYGLAGNVHTNAPNGFMWQGGTKPGWFRVNLDRECYVETMRVWNYNEASWTHRGSRIVDLYTAAVDPGTNAIGGAGWELLEANRVLAQAPGLSTYSTPEVITVNRTALYIGMIIYTNFAAIVDGNIGLSEVQVIGTPLPTVPITNLTATASTSESANQLPIRAIDQSGFAGKAHDNTWSNMWLSQASAPGWYKVDLGQVYQLRRIDAWNYNQNGWTSRGVGTANIYTAMTDPGTNPGGAGWTQVRTNQYFTVGTAAVGYDTPTRLLMNHRARYVGFEILTSQSGNKVGFSELQFHADPPSGTVILFR